MKAEIKLKLPENHAAPIFDLPSDLINPQAEWVISQDENGCPISYFGDESWDLSSYRNPYRKFNIVFQCGKRRFDNSCLEFEVKRQSFLLLYVQTEIIFSILYYRKLVNTLCRVASYCERAGIELQEFWGLPSAKYDFCLAHPSQTGNVLSIENFLDKIGYKLSGVRIIKDGFISNKLRSMSFSIKQNYSQTVPVPSNIFSDFVSNMTSLLTLFLKHEDKIFEAIDLCCSDRKYGRFVRNQGRKCKSDTVSSGYDFPSLVSLHRLDDCFNGFDVKPVQVKSFVKLLTRVQLVCKLIIHIYSGMRDSEASSLPFDCLVIEEEFGRKHFKITGVTTKSNGGFYKYAEWITSKEGALAIEASKRISRKIYSWIGNENLVKENSMFLFPSMANVYSLVGMALSVDNVSPASLDICSHADFVKQNLAIISERDIVELELIDAHRAFRSEEKFSIGKKWSLTTHQLRRSLSIFASASGFVSLPSMKRQLQHITEEMAIYYSRGSSFAKNILKAFPNHYCREYQEGCADSAAFSYMVHVLNSQEKLYGGHGAWVERQGRLNEKILYEREKTLKRFRNGEISFVTTPLGGCSSVDPCNHRAMASVLECVNCKNAVIKEGALRLVIKEYDSYLKKQEEGTVQYKLIREDFDNLERLLNELNRRSV